MSEFLLEIGCEDMPHWMIAGASRSLKDLLQGELARAGVLGRGGVETYDTHRRLIAYCRELREREPERESQQLGPPKSVAFDAAGRATQAATSFAAKQGVPVKALRVVKTPKKGEYVAAVKRTRGRLTAELLQEALPGIIGSISFPRTMYWTARGGPRFVRPVRWLLALYGGRVIEFEFGGVQAGRTTCGHRFGGGSPLTVRNFADYRRKLRGAWVLIDRGERASKIRREQQKFVAGRGLRLPEKTELYLRLMSFAVDSAEFPSVVPGEFDAEFLRLPAEILRTVMTHQQKFFCVETSEGKLSSRFLAVVDRDPGKLGSRAVEEIRRGHERVLAARFRDAEFFWNTERMVKLEGRVRELAGITFAAGLGSYQEKTERVERLAGWLARNVAADGRRADAKAVERAARLCKGDLTTHMVGEFPELQGIVGGLYAREQGAEEKVWRAIYEHYRPTTATDEPPKTIEGAIVSVADKVDSVVACFGVGLEPTGSSDPLGLRRAALGAIRTVLKQRLRVDLRGMLGESVGIVAAQVSLKSEPGERLARLWEFFLERARHALGEFAYDEINAVFASDPSDLVDAQARLGAVSRVRPSPHFEPLSVAFKRIRNILEQAGNRSQAGARAIRAELLQAGAERELYEAFERLRPQVAELRAQQRYEEALRLIASLRPQVDRFFDDVLVMAEEQALRENRLALLGHLYQEFSAIADFSEIVPAQPAAASRARQGR